MIILSDIEAQRPTRLDAQSPVGGCIGAQILKVRPEPSVRTHAFDARCRVTDAQNLQQRDDEEPGAGDTAAAPQTKGAFRGDAEESNVGDTTSAQPAANG
jgi:hypothetical protein